MVSKSKTHFLKNDITFIQSRSHQQKTNQIIKRCHQQSPITVLVPLSMYGKVYLGRPCVGLRAIYRRCSNSPPHKSHDFPVRLGLWTSHRRYIIMHPLASKTPCSVYVLQDVSKNSHLTQANFLVNHAKLAKLGF